MPAPLTLTPLLDFPLIQTGDDLAGIILHRIEQAGMNLVDGDILIVTSKIVSKAEDRLVNLAQVTPSTRAIQLGVQTDKDPRLVELILRESKQVLRTRPGAIIVEHRLGFVCANAGIDHSNVQESPGIDKGQVGAAIECAGEHDKTEVDHLLPYLVLLLPEDPDASAKAIRQRLEVASGASLGVLIIDSHGRAWRLGTVGTAIGLSGVPGLVDLRGRPDLFGFRLQITQIGAADELAAAASLVMGQADEGAPVVHARGFPYPFREASLSELLRPRDQDLFR